MDYEKDENEPKKLQLVHIKKTPLPSRQSQKNNKKDYLTSPKAEWVKEMSEAASEWMF